MVSSKVIAESQDTEMTGFLGWLYGGVRGSVVIATFDRSESSSPIPHERQFEWPRQAGQVFAYVEQQRQREWIEVWHCPLPRKTRNKRTGGDALSHRIVWADVDHTMGSALMDRIKERGFYVIATGTPGHVQIYARMDRDLTPGEHRAIQTGLRELVSGDDKIADNDLLKIPATWNYKNHQFVPEAKRNPQAYQVHTLHQGSRSVHTGQFINWLQLLLNRELDMSGAPVRAHTMSRLPDDYEYPEAKMRPDALQHIFHHRMPDRSGNTSYLVKSLHERGFTLPEIIGVALNHPPTIDHNIYPDRVITDVERLYNKIKAGLPDDDTFWSTRPILAHIYESACAGFGVPLAVLGAVMARVAVATPLSLRLPDDGSLNLFVGLVGPPAAGKGTAMRIARRCVDVGMIKTVPVGSGEGLSHLFGRRSKGTGEIEIINHSAVLDVPEVDTLVAIGGRNGSTLSTQLRMAYSGENLGASNADPAKSIIIPGDQYRLSLVVGVQPERAGPLLSESDGGTPQRFLWLPATTDEDLPEPSMPDPWEWDLGVLNQDTITVCQTAREAVKEARRIGRKGLGNHTTFTRLKIAAVLALMECRVDVTDDDWDLAGAVVAMSDDTLKAVKVRLADVATAANITEGKREGVKRAASVEAEWATHVRRVSLLVVRILSKTPGEWQPRTTMFDGLGRKSNRDYLDDALRLLVRDKTVQIKTFGEVKKWKVQA